MSPKTPLTTNTSTDAWEKLPRKLQRAFKRKDLRPLILVGGDQLFFAEITSDLELKVLATAQPNTYLGDVKLTDETDTAEISGTALHTKRVHGDNVHYEWSNTVEADATRHYYSVAPSASLDAYVYAIMIYITDNEAFMNAAGEFFILSFENQTAGIKLWGKQVSYDRGFMGTFFDTSYRFEHGWNFASPYHIPAGATLRVWFYNFTGNSLNTVDVTVSYYLS